MHLSLVSVPYVSRNRGVKDKITQKPKKLKIQRICNLHFKPTDFG